MAPQFLRQPAGAVRALIAAARRHGVPLAVDLNYRGRLWPSRAAAAAALADLAREGDYVLAGGDELELLGDGAIAELVGGRARAVVVSRGADGAELHMPAGVTRHAAPAVAAVDTVGAGDALAAGFLSGVLDGLAPPAALARGVATATFAVCTAGDWEGLPSRAELELLGLDDGATVR